MWPDTEIFVLGPLVVRRDGEDLAIGGRNAKIVLGTLVVSVNHSVSADQLSWAVWGEEQPDSVKNTIQTYVSRLRQLLGPESITTEDHSYRLEASCEQIDSCRFERMVSEAEIEIADNPEAAMKLTREALALWRGAPFGELGFEEFAQLEAIRLNELRLNAVEIEVEAEIRSGREHEAVARLHALTHEHPLRERFWHQLVRGLAAVDRRPEAILTYFRYCEALADSGLEPDLSLEELLQT
jgi:DNA-binding SARP family transcriptional activator